MTVVGVPAAPAEGDLPAHDSRFRLPQAPRRVAAIAVLFGLSSLASASFVANLIPTLAERSINPTTGALKAVCLA
jgi:hypothetical protein